MTLYEILTDGGLTLVAILTLIQIAPLKVNPWSWTARMLGRALNSELLDHIKETEANTARYRILRFDDEIRQGIVLHSKEHFDQILAEIDMYERYCGSHPDYKNSKTVMAIDKIKKTYQKCKDDNSFI